MFNVNLPSWITKHGTVFSNAKIQTSEDGMIVEITNSVPFVGGIKGLKRRIQWALTEQTKALTKQVEHYAIKQAARKSGFKVK